MKNRNGLALLFLLLSAALSAQDTTRHGNYFKLGSSYLSNAVYSGRRDSATVPYFYAEIDYVTKLGFYIGSKAAYLAKPGVHQIDNVSVDAGYNFTLGKNLSGEIYGSHNFYNDSSFAVMSTITASGGGSISYELPAISLTAGSYLEFSSKTDISTSLSASHRFEVSFVSISPTVEMSAGTQNFYRQYLVEKKIISQIKNSKKGKGSGSSGSGNSNSGNGNGSGGGSTTVTTTVQTIAQKDATRFKVLDYEIKLPITAERGRLEFFFTPVYAIPVHPATILSTSGAVVRFTEILQNSFYAEMGFIINLGKQ